MTRVPTISLSALRTETLPETRAVPPFIARSTPVSVAFATRCRRLSSSPAPRGRLRNPRDIGLSRRESRKSVRGERAPPPTRSQIRAALAIRGRIELLRRICHVEARALRRVATHLQVRIGGDRCLDSNAFEVRGIELAQTLVEPGDGPKRSAAEKSSSLPSITSTNGASRLTSRAFAWLPIDFQSVIVIIQVVGDEGCGARARLSSPLRRRAGSIRRARRDRRRGPIAPRAGRAPLFPIDLARTELRDRREQ